MLYGVAMTSQPFSLLQVASVPLGSLDLPGLHFPVGNSPHLQHSTSSSSSSSSATSHSSSSRGNNSSASSASSSTQQQQGDVLQAIRSAKNRRELADLFERMKDILTNEELIMLCHQLGTVVEPEKMTVATSMKVQVQPLTGNHAHTD